MSAPLCPSETPAALRSLTISCTASSLSPIRHLARPLQKIVVAHNIQSSVRTATCDPQPPICNAPPLRRASASSEQPPLAAAAAAWTMRPEHTEHTGPAGSRARDRHRAGLPALVSKLHERRLPSRWPPLVARAATLGSSRNRLLKLSRTQSARQRTNVEFV